MDASGPDSAPPRRGRGGRRPGAGRPQLYAEPLVQVTVKLPASYVAQLQAAGGGNVSEGIRWLVEHARTATGEAWYAPTPRAGESQP
jgi:hypothetical protein